jgi:hypothetical protein
MQEASQQMQSAFAVYRRGGINWPTAAATRRITDFAFAHALNATVAVAAALLPTGGCKRELRRRGWEGGDGCRGGGCAEQFADGLDHDGNRHIAADCVAGMRFVLATRH